MKKFIIVCLLLMTACQSSTPTPAPSLFPTATLLPTPIPLTATPAPTPTLEPTPTPFPKFFTTEFDSDSSMTGWVVLQAVPSGGFNQELPWSNALAQYYVLRDRVALFGNEITNPQQSTIPPGLPDVTFGFTRAGGNAYQTVTAQVTLNDVPLQLQFAGANQINFVVPANFPTGPCAPVLVKAVGAWAVYENRGCFKPDG